MLIKPESYYIRKSKIGSKFTCSLATWYVCTLLQGLLTTEGQGVEHHKALYILEGCLLVLAKCILVAN